MERGLASAEQALSDVRYLLLDDRLDSAANRVYYAAFYASLAALAHLGFRPAKSHGGVIRQVNRQLVQTSILNRRFASVLRDTYDLRRLSDYELFTSFPQDRILAIADEVEAYIGAIRDIVARRD